MDPYIGEIRLFAGYYAPVDWAFCNGTIVAIVDYETLFALIGTRYGGDGRTNFGLPDMRGRVPVGMGLAPVSGTEYVLGGTMGQEFVTLTDANLPPHNHQMFATSSPAASADAQGLMQSEGLHYVDPSNAVKRGALSTESLHDTGLSQPHDNMMPTMGLNFIIAMKGLFPPRN